MAVQAPLLKSAPDFAKINQFNGMLVTVTQHMGPKPVNGKSVVATQPMTKEQLMELQATGLIAKAGAGYYHFVVVDQGGTGEDEWMVKIGEPPQQEGQMPGPMFTPPGMSAAAPFGAGPAPLDPALKQIMPGFWYNPELGLLHTRWGATVTWREGDPWPTPPANTGTTPVNPGAAQWAYPGWNNIPAWGAWDPSSKSSSEMELLKQQVEEQKRQLEVERQRRADEERRRESDEARAATQRMIEENQRQMMLLVEKLTAKPSGPSEAELRAERDKQEAQRRADEAERRREEAEQRREDEKRRAEEREERRREEAARDERHREEMRAFREANSNKPDPLAPILTLFGQVMQSTQASGAETARMVRETSQSAAAAADRSMTQVLELARSRESGMAEASKVAIEGVKESMSLQREVFSQALDLANQSGGSPWVNIAGQALEKIGSVGEVLAARAQQAQQPQQQVAYTPPQQPQPPRQAAPPIITVPPANPGGAPRPGFIDTGARPDGAVFDSANDQWALPGGYRVPNSYVQQHGWARTIEELSRQATLRAAPSPAPATGEGVAAGPMNGAAGPAVPAETSGPAASVTPIASARAARKPAGRRRASRRGAPRPPADKKGYSVEEMKDIDPEEVMEAVKAFDDPTFFDEFWAYVQRMRAGQEQGQLTPEQAVTYILQGRTYMRQLGKMPPVMQVMESEQFEVLGARMFPNAPPAFRKELFERLNAVVEGEAGETAIAPADGAAGAEAEHDDEGEEDDEESGGGA